MPANSGIPNANVTGLAPGGVKPKLSISRGGTCAICLLRQGCCLVGHPDYYKKLGFENVSGLVIEGVPPEVFLALSFAGYMPRGTVAFHEAFMANEPQAAPAADCSY